jgi:high affinity Mn2+ porin
MGRMVFRAGVAHVCLLLLAIASAQTARAQSVEPPPAPASQNQEQNQQPETTNSDLSAQGAPTPNQSEPVTLFPHLKTDRIWLSGQANIISQWHPAFRSPYQGPNSLSPEAQDASSRVLTLFTGLRLTDTTEFLCDIQETGGHGIGEALGLAGFTNLDVVRNPRLGKPPYVARLMWHQIIPIGRERDASDRTSFSLSSKLPRRRLEIRLGKFSLADFFDSNTYGSDSNLQFLNWTVDNNGAYDYAADTRGFTFGAMLEYDDRHWSLRFAEALMPKVANGIHLDADLSRARAENLEFELRGTPLPHRDGVLRLLTFINHANMGSYQQAIDDYLDGLTPKPEITAHPLQSTVKYGFGINFEQHLNDWIGLFGRWGWNEGQHESYVYTEVDETLLFGVGANGKRWKRNFDRAGIAYNSNGISHDHQEYLALGGDGFLLGDGKLNYGRENISEFYYTLHIWRGIFSSFDFQSVDHPGYNRDRGPVFAPALRLHVDF